MTDNTSDGIDPRAAAAAVAASATSVGAATAAIVGNTMAVCMDVDVPVQALPPLADIWACTKIRKYTTTENKKMWICEWCPKGLNGSKPFTGWNATKVLWHLCKIAGNGIRPCSGVILPEYARQYKDYYEKRMLNSQAREERVDLMSGEIDVTQAVAVATTLASSSRRRRGFTSEPMINLADGPDADDHSANDNRKRPFETSQTRLTTTTPAPSSNSNAPPNHFASRGAKTKTPKNKRQQKIWNGTPDPESSMKMDIAIADLIHSNVLPFTFGKDMKFQKCIDIARRLPPDYVPPDRHAVGGPLLNALYSINWTEGITMLLADCQLYGITLFGDGATIKTIPMINALAAGVNNPFALLDVFDCSEHCSKAGKKDAPYIAKLFLPLIKRLEESRDKNNKM